MTAKTHQKELERLKTLQKKAFMGGGEKAMDRHRSKGKLTARERLDLLFDPGSFVELNDLAESQCMEFGMEKRKVPGDGVVIGYGMIDGRTAFAYAQDSTVLGGSVGTIHGQKICRIMDEALKVKAPLICLNDSGGGRLHEGFFASKGVAGMFLRNTAASGVIPQISCIMGPCAGVSVYSPALTDFIIMIEKQSQMVITGPKVIQDVTGETVNLEELGGARVHSRITGQAHFVTKTDSESIQLIRYLLSFLPSNHDQAPPSISCNDPLERKNESLTDIVPAEFKRAYDMHQVICEVVDNKEFLEILPEFAPNIITGLARLNGDTVGIVGNQPSVMAGCLDYHSSDKAARFIRFCDCFNIPLVNFVDVPGYFPGVDQEHAGIIRHGAKMLYSYAEATVPKITLALRKEYGGAVMAMCCAGMGVDLMLAWPVAQLVVLDTAAAINIIYRKDILEAEDPQAFKAQKIQEYDYKYSNPFHAASNMLVDKIIEPSETRTQIIKALLMLKNKKRPEPFRKHGNIPL
ncbi:MAG: methylmalonyl-CoA carboxyltransferase [Proteobacteria bacterium]|nr:methylmalonyl-CoA carboxyltransferase [Pseudomonadota bacterium]MBU1585354.1 methylmalonyl-CoA carboxyltransferase [Pseudomonadota bacterium]MBU2455314.1 methylmalonyl-CoA carboxyltransferase [Pseudomonadota bacterium]